MSVTRRGLFSLAWVVCVITALVGPAGAAPGAVVGPGAGVSSEVVPPDTLVGRQMSWLLDVSQRLPVSDGEARAHLSARFLDQVGLDRFNAVLDQAAGPDGFTLATFRPQYTVEQTVAAASVIGDKRTWHLNLIVDDAGLVRQLEIAAVPASWREVEARLRAVAPQMSFQAAEIDRSGCRPEHAIAAGVARPLGSLFKVYVLGALADAVATGQAAWDEQLTVRADWQSLGPNPVDTAQPGTRFTLRQLANHMIAFSDNSATDHLIHRLGRAAVERQQHRFGLQRPDRNRPWLTTRELYQLRLTDHPTLAHTYLTLNTGQRREFLHTVIAPLPLPAGPGSWPQPRDIDRIEWFASPVDLCRAHHGLTRQAATPELDPVDHALSRYENYLALDRNHWPTVWFKGGSEPGVMTLSYLARTADGRTFSITAMASDPATPIPPERFHELITIIHGAFLLTAR